MNTHTNHCACTGIQAPGCHCYCHISKGPLILIDKETGQEYAYHGLMREPMEGEEYLARGGVQRATWAYWTVYPIVVRVPKRHTFGRVVYEETGETRPLQHGDVGLDTSGGSGYPCLWPKEIPSGWPFRVLKPVEILPHIEGE